MRKLSLLPVVAVLILAGCSRKTHPSGNKLPPTVIVPPKPVSPVPNNPPMPVDSAATPAPATMGSPMIVVDGSGNIVTWKDKLPPDIAAKLNYSKLARSFTPDQKKNLVYRFKMIPPKVLYVPDGYVSKSARGKYIIYRTKFWYWQKADGLFHLDETYYR